MAIQGVIFDLGHTLMHLDGTWPEMFEQGAWDLVRFLERHEPGIDALALARTWLERRDEGYARARATMHEVTAGETMRRSLAQYGLLHPHPELLAGAIDAFFAHEEARWFADPEAIPVLRTLSDRGLRLGMLSNATHDPLIQRLVDRLGFRPYLDPALSSASTGIRKPDPAAFAPLLEAWALSAASVVVVGDTLEADILGAQQAGMRSVYLRSREDARQEGVTVASASRTTTTAKPVIASSSPARAATQHGMTQACHCDERSELLSLWRGAIPNCDRGDLLAGARADRTGVISRSERRLRATKQSPTNDPASRTTAVPDATIDKLADLPHCLLALGWI